MQPWCIPFLIWNQSVVPCPVPTIASWPAYRFLRRQVRWSGIAISWRIFHSLLWFTQSKALVWSMKKMFFWNPLAFSMIQWMLAIWSQVPLPFLITSYLFFFKLMCIERVEDGPPEESCGQREKQALSDTQPELQWGEWSSSLSLAPTPCRRYSWRSSSLQSGTWVIGQCSEGQRTGDGQRLTSPGLWMIITSFYYFTK